jgi:hypothetical protein
MRPRVLGPAGRLDALGPSSGSIFKHSGRVGRSRRRSNPSNSVQQPFWRVPQTQSARPSHKRKTSAIFQYETIRPVEPSASVRRNAVHDLGYPHNAACLKLCGIQPVVDATLLVDLQGSMDENRPSVIGGPASVLDVFGAPSDQVRPRLADRKNFHGPVLCHIWWQLPLQGALRADARR